MKVIGGYEVKCCPFCKKEEVDIQRETGLYFVVCLNIDCSAAGPVDFGISGAIAKWNERAIDEIEYTAEDIAAGEEYARRCAAERQSQEER